MAFLQSVYNKFPPVYCSHGWRGLYPCMRSAVRGDASLAARHARNWQECVKFHAANHLVRGHGGEIYVLSITNVAKLWGSLASEVMFVYVGAAIMFLCSTLYSKLIAI